MCLNRFKILRASLCFLLWLGACRAASAQEKEEPIVVSQVQVNARAFPISSGATTKFPASPATVKFTYGSTRFDGVPPTPMRIRYKLEGMDSDWHEKPKEMRLVIGFLDQNGSELKDVEFLAKGQSLGWTGNFETAALQHRHETVVVPAGATRFWAVMTSAGGPESLGVFVISDFVVQTQTSTNGPARELLRYSSDAGDAGGLSLQTPTGWMRDGISPQMAKVIQIGSAPRKNALAILDENPHGHAQWNTLKAEAPLVTPGEQLVIQWDEMFSVGWATPTDVTYQDLTPGYYRFNLNQLTLMGLPTEVDYSMQIQVPLPFWKAPWFWVAVFTVAMTLVFFAERYRAWRRLQAENTRLAHQQALERQRIRIAQDIHDDLGARVTQISLVSALAERTVSEPETSRAGFQNITQMARELVASLYDTIWVVNPENDNLEAVGNYLCQWVNQLSSQAGLRCRLEVPSLPANIPISSHQRHNLTMAVKEALHNVIKHAQASEVRMKIILTETELNLFIQDDGRGFDLQTVVPGSGLGNLKHRLRDVGGDAEVNCSKGRGTLVHLRMPLDKWETSAFVEVPPADSPDA